MTIKLSSNALAAVSLISAAAVATAEYGNSFVALMMFVFSLVVWGFGNDGKAAS